MDMEIGLAELGRKGDHELNLDPRNISRCLRAPEPWGALGAAGRYVRNEEPLPGGVVEGSP